jgi:hypothetical protein
MTEIMGKTDDEKVEGWKQLIVVAETLEGALKECSKGRSRRGTCCRALSISTPIRPRSSWRGWSANNCGGRQELGTMNHGAELDHVGTVSTSRRQRSTHLGAKICGAEPCYLDATSYGLNVNIFSRKVLKYKKKSIAWPGFVILPNYLR